MSNNQWTEEQREAIYSGDRNLLVAAAAGTGKTAVLVERVLTRLMEKDPLTGEYNTDVDNLLIVTFTKAAASEMRQRVATALAAKLNELSASKAGNPALRNHLERQLALIANAQITTVHAFCMDLVRRYFYQLDLDPEFRIAVDTEATLMMLDVLESLFEDKYLAEDNAAFLRLVDAYGGSRGDEKLMEMVLQIANFSRSLPWPQYWLANLAAAYRPECREKDGQWPWMKKLLQYLALEFQACRCQLVEALNLVNSPGGPAAYGENIKDDLAIVDDLLRAKTWQQLTDIMTQSNFTKLKSVSKKEAVDEEKKERVKQARDKVKKLIKGMREEYFYSSETEIVAQMEAAVPIVEALAQLAQEFNQAYSEAKKQKAMLDFNDLEHYCLEILLDKAAKPHELIPSAVAIELQRRFVEVLVDEYQDTNSVQETLLNLITRQNSPKPNLFMVGDVKQSIYRFRLAEPQLFLHKFKQYTLEGSGRERRIDLTKNFRSRKSIIDGTNFIFRQIMSAALGEIDYDSKAELLGGAQFPATDLVQADAKIEVLLINKESQEVGAAQDFAADNHTTQHFEPDAHDGENEETENEDELRELENIETPVQEARLVAKRIKALVGAEAGAEFAIYDKKTGAYRSLTYRDIVILLRATVGWADSFLEEFRAAGIPAYAELGSGYFEATEVETMLALLEIIDNPHQDISLTAVLRSPLVGLNANELAEIRLIANSILAEEDLDGSSPDFFSQVTLAAANEDAAFTSKVRKLLADLEEWRTLARRGPLAKLIWLIYSETGYYDYVGGMPGGSQRQANLRALYDRALEYERTSMRGLYRFLRFIEKARSKGTDMGAARALGENENVVRIMSIHKSKGLEFPVVFIAGMGKKFNDRDRKQEVLLHKELGLGIDLVDPEMGVSYGSLYKTAIKQAIKFESLAEEMRLLYVAMTRAREKLIITGSVASLEKEVRKWTLAAESPTWQLPASQLADGNTFLHWIGPALLRHRDGKKLLSIGEGEETFYAPADADVSSWKVEIFQSSQLQVTDKAVMENKIVQRVKGLLPVDQTSSAYKQTAAWLDWHYPHPVLAEKSSKTTVSELKRRFAALDQDEMAAVGYQQTRFDRPQFMQEFHGLSPAERGSAMHLVMQHLDLAKGTDIQVITAQVQGMAALELLTPEQELAIDVKKITAFFETALGKRVLKSQQVRRELPFTLALPALEVYQDAQLGESFDLATEKILVQGIIDCLFAENGALILLDYKTDRVSNGNSQAIVERYQVQLRLYARAVENILQQKVAEKWIYLFDTNQCLQIS